MEIKEEYFTQKIYINYPEVWKKLINEYHERGIDDNADFYIYFEKYYILIDCKENCEFCETELEFVAIIPFYMLYGLLEDFFEKNGFNLYINLADSSKKYRYDIQNDTTLKYIARKNGFNFRPCAKQSAILKMCEILERWLKNGTN